MRIALAQMKNEGTIEKNLKKSISLIKEACIMAVPNIYLEEGGNAYDASMLIDRSSKFF